MSILHHAIPNDPYYNDVVLHLRGYDAQSGQVFKDYSKYNRTISVFGNTSHSTTQKKYGNSSIYFDGSGDYLTAPASSDFNFGTGAFTIEFFYYKNSNTSYGVYRRLIQSVDGDVICGFTIVDDNNYISVAMSSSGGSFDLININNIVSLVVGNWYFISLIRNGVDFYLIVNGVSYFLAQSSSSVYFNASHYIVIGGQASGRNINGFYEDLRVTKGIARPIAVPTQPFPNF